MAEARSPRIVPKVLRCQPIKIKSKAQALRIMYMPSAELSPTEGVVKGHKGTERPRNQPQKIVCSFMNFGYLLRMYRIMN
jgi:hypothetical protein